MRRLHRLFLLAPAVALPLLPLGCEDSSSSPASIAYEAGPGFEAGPAPEAGPLPDASVPALGVTVTVTDRGLPRANDRVLFHDATGAVIGEAVTDVTGKASTVTAPSMVTVLTVTSNVNAEPAAVTFMGVEAGDQLRVVTQTAPDVVTAAGSYDVTLAGDLLANATNVSVVTMGPCSGGGPNTGATVSVPLVPACVGPTNAVLASASNGGGVLGFAFAKGLVGPTGPTIAVPVGPLTLAVPGRTRVTATNVPVGSFPNVSLYHIANDQLLTTYSGTGDLAVAGVDFPTPTGFADAYQSEVVLRGPGASAETKLLRRDATSATASETLPPFDLATLLPLIASTPIARTVPARPEVTITLPTGASFASADAGVVTINYASNANAVRWTFIVPPSTTTFKVPALPANAAAYDPSDPGVQIESAVYFDVSSVPDYKAARKLPVAPSIGVDLADRAGRVPLPLPTGTSLRLSRWQPG